MPEIEINANILENTHMEMYNVAHTYILYDGAHMDIQQNEMNCSLGKSRGIEIDLSLETSSRKSKFGYIASKIK